MRFLSSCCLSLLLAFSASVSAQAPNGELIEVAGAKAAVILAHGRAQGPDGQVVGLLRHSIARDAGMDTLSLQLPVLPTSDYLAYAATFPDAYKTLRGAIDYLIKERQIKRIYILGYSMGARMTTAFLAAEHPREIVGYIGIGVLEGGGNPLDANVNIQKVGVPVLDLHADSTPLDRSSAENRKNLPNDRYTMTRIRGANHSFKGYESALSEASAVWLKQQEAKQ